jgi:bacterioferritin
MNSAVQELRQRLVLDQSAIAPTTRRMLEEILTEEEEHADELKDWLGH